MTKNRICLDAALSLPDGTSYIFRSKWYFKYESGGVAAYRPITTFWKGLWTDLDAAALVPSGFGLGLVLFFQGDKVRVYDLGSDKVVGEFTPISSLISNWPDDWTHVDAAVTWPNGFTYIFRDQEYIKCTLTPFGTGVVVQDPQLISKHWIGWQQQWTHVDAVLVSSEGDIALFFVDDQWFYYSTGQKFAEGVIGGTAYPVNAGAGQYPGSWPGLCLTEAAFLASMPQAVPPRVYFFEGTRYFRADILTQNFSNGTGSIKRKWPGLPLTVDCAVTWYHGKLYFFSGNMCYRYDMAEDRVDDNYPKPIDIEFGRGLPTWIPGTRPPWILGNGPLVFTQDTWPSSGWDSLDACVAWGDGKVYFFKGDSYITYDPHVDLVSIGPQLLSTIPDWPWRYAKWRKIDAAMLWPDGTIYFFSDDECHRHDMRTNRSVPGYPRLIEKDWKNWPTSFDMASGKFKTRRMDTCVTWIEPPLATCPDDLVHTYYRLPFGPNQKWKVSNGNFDDPAQDPNDLKDQKNHNGAGGLQDYAFDFVPDAGNGSYIRAARGGTVYSIRAYEFVGQGFVKPDLDVFLLDADLPTVQSVVKEAGGNYIIIMHVDGSFGTYWHIRQWGVLVKEGDMVRRGAIIGLVGETGHATGIHLHFDVRYGWITFQPEEDQTDQFTMGIRFQDEQHPGCWIPRVDEELKSNNS